MIGSLAYTDGAGVYIPIDIFRQNVSLHLGAKYNAIRTTWYLTRVIFRMTLTTQTE